MGFRPEAKHFTIKFAEEHELHGLTIKTRSVPIGTVLDVMRGAGAQMKGGRPVNVEDVEAVERLFVNFGGALIEWNLDHPDTGEPVPATEAGVRSLDFDLVTTLAMEWVGAMMGASAPLAPGSTPGGKPLSSIPMEPLTSSPVS